jgi:hypothetical protein
MDYDFLPEGVPSVPSVSEAPEAFRYGKHQWELLPEYDEPSLFLVAPKEIEWGQIVGWSDDCIQVKTNENEWEYWDEIHEDAFGKTDLVEARYLHYFPGGEIVD